MIKAIVFDFDGLILDTETPEFESFQAMYIEHGAELSLDLWGKCVGTDGSAFEPYAHLEGCLGRSLDREQLRLKRRADYDAKMIGQIPRPGVTDYLQRAKELGLKIGLASSSSRQWVGGYLEQHGLLDYFACIRTREDVARVKPDPALYLSALQALGVRPDEAIAFEDSPNGALAAKTAGMFCVIVPNPVTSLLTFGDTDLRIDSMGDMALEDVLKSLSGQS
ncbi:HAD family hydrolase [Paenibacillus sp. TAB 01]|uniref:HAD family hydrolase n=1 Tax=Paenibacillus sp. TAB 01 TaxID=3368988 RepID=UPI00375388F3